MRVLVVRLSAMGDVAMTAPVVAAAARAHSDVQFDVLSTAFFQPFFAPMSNVQFIGTDIKKHKGVVSIWRLYKQLKINDYDLVVDLHDVVRTKLLRAFFALGGVKTYTINKGRRQKKMLVNGSAKKQLRTSTERYADVFALAGLHVGQEKEVQTKQIPPIIDGISAKNDEKWIGIAPFAQHRGKILPLERTRRVAELLSEAGARIFIFGGGEQEKNVAETWAADIPRCHSAIGKVRLAGELALISNLDCMLSMDSSAMHMASLFGVRVVSVWGATHIFAGFLGYGQSKNDVLQLELDCRPCSIYGNKPCRFGDYRCLDIAPEQIAEKILNG